MEKRKMNKFPNQVKKEEELDIGGVFQGQIGFYEVVEELGQGGYGKTYKASVVREGKLVPDAYVVLKFPNVNLNKTREEIRSRLIKFGDTFKPEFK